MQIEGLLKERGILPHAVRKILDAKDTYFSRISNRYAYSQKRSYSFTTLLKHNWLIACFMKLLFF